MGRSVYKALYLVTGVSIWKQQLLYSSTRSAVEIQYSSFEEMCNVVVYSSMDLDYGTAVIRLQC